LLAEAVMVRLKKSIASADQSVGFFNRSVVFVDPIVAMPSSKPSPIILLMTSPKAFVSASRFSGIATEQFSGLAINHR
jgi:hypothetical protein